MYTYSEIINIRNLSNTVSFFKLYITGSKTRDKLASSALSEIFMYFTVAFCFVYPIR